MTPFNGQGAPFLDTLVDIASLCRAENPRGAALVLTRPGFWERICRELQRPMTIESVERRGVIVTHVAGYEVRIMLIRLTPTVRLLSDVRTRPNTDRRTSSTPASQRVPAKIGIR